MRPAAQLGMIQPGGLIRKEFSGSVSDRARKGFPHRLRRNTLEATRVLGSGEYLCVSLIVRAPGVDAAWGQDQEGEGMPSFLFAEGILPVRADSVWASG